MAAPQPVLTYPRSKDQRDDGGGVQPHPQELIAVGGQLQECPNFGVTGKFGVPNLVAARVAGARSLVDQEVGVAEELAVEKRRLKDHICPGAEGELGFRVLCLQLPAQVLATF